jgi:hypothetical protein
MAVPAVALGAIVAAKALLLAPVTPLVSRRLTARLAVTRAALVSLEVSVAAAAMATPPIGSFGIELALAGIPGLGFGLRGLGWRAAKKFLHPAKHSSRFFRFRRRGGGGAL